MRGGFRRSMAWLHTWIGVAMGWALFVILATGALSVFQAEVTTWMEAPPASWLRAAAGGGDGEALSPHRVSHGGRIFVLLHYSLYAGDVGIWLVGLLTVGLLTAVVTGLIIHVRLFRDFFTFRARAGARSWRDAHAALGVAVLPFLVMIAYSGLVLMSGTYMPAPRLIRYGAEPPPRAALEAPVEAAPAAPAFALTRHPPIYRTPDGVRGSAARSVRQTFVALHLVQFGGPVVRWLYFLSSLAAAGAVAAGLSLYVAQRRRRHADLARDAAAGAFALDAVERVSCGAVAGLCLAGAACFWINRLLPVGAANRPDTEVALAAAAWAACFAHAGLRPLRTAWREQAAATALLCAGLPLLDALTTDGWALAAAARGSWGPAAVDLTALAAAAAFALWAAALRPRAADGALGRRTAPDAA